MSKTAKIVLGVLVVAIVAIGITVSLVLGNLDSIVRRALETAGSDAVGAPVKVGRVSINLREGSGEVGGLRIANPTGYPRGDAISLNRIGVDLDLEQVSPDLVVLDSVIVDGVTINAIQEGKRSNLQALLDRLRSGAGGGGASSPGDAGGGPETKLIIREFRFTNAKLSLSLPALAEQRTVTVPNIVLRDIGKKSGGVTAAEAARQILDPLMRKSVQAATGLVGAELENQAREKADAVLKEQAGKLGEKLGGFLGGGK